MPTETAVPMIGKAAQTANVWLNEIESKLQNADSQGAYHALRGVLFALRDCIAPEEAAHLGDQLPVLIRGVYYEGYALGGKPENIRHPDDFLRKVEHETKQSPSPVEARNAVEAVTKVLAEHIDGGQYRQVKQGMTLEIRELFGH